MTLVRPARKLVYVDVFVLAHVETDRAFANGKQRHTVSLVSSAGCRIQSVARANLTAFRSHDIACLDVSIPRMHSFTVVCTLRASVAVNAARISMSASFKRFQATAAWWCSSTLEL